MAQATVYQLREKGRADDAAELEQALNRTMVRDIRAVVEDCVDGIAVCKVIIETALLTDDEKRRASELSRQARAHFVKTSTGFASGGANEGHQYDLDRPLESLAEGLLLGVRDAMDSMFFQNHAIENMIDEFAADGVVYHPIKSCRTVSTGLADGRRHLTDELGIPSLFIESDMMDRRVVSEAQMKNRIDAFFEGLASRRQQALAANEG